MKKDWISGAVSVVIIAASSALGIMALGRTEENPERYIENDYKDYSVLSEEVTTADYTVTSAPVTTVLSGGSITTVPVTSAVTASVTTAAVTTTTVPVTTTEAVTTTVTTQTEPVQTEAPQTEAPPQEATQTDPPVQNEQPAPEPPPEPQPDPEPENNNYEIYIPDSASEFQKEILRLVNEKRAEHGLRGLSGSDQLNWAADIRASEICSLFEHRRPDGREWYTVYSDCGLAPGYFGENIAAGHSTPAETIEQWMGSEGHRANILNANYTTMGAGYFERDDSDYHYYWVQLFS